MDFQGTFNLIADVLEAIGSSIKDKKYDGLMVKKLESSNTLDPGRTTKQSHIAITGAQMDLFPYIRADGYFEVDYDQEDSELKKFFIAQIPAYLHRENAEYLAGQSQIHMDPEELVHISIVRSRRNKAADQIQMSMTYKDSPQFIQFRKWVHAGSYLIILKREKELVYDVYAVKNEDSCVGAASLGSINNCFCKLPTSTSVKLADILVEKTPEDEEDRYDAIFDHNVFGIHIQQTNDALSEVRPHVCIGWPSLGDLSCIQNKTQLAELYDLHYNKSARGKGQDVGQIWRFLKTVSIGDYIIFAASGVFHIGRIVSDYYYDDSIYPEQCEDYVNYRKVQWLKTNISRSILSKNLHNSLKTAMSIWSMNDYKSAVLDLLRDRYGKDDEDSVDEEPPSLTCLDITREARTNKLFPLNFIVYGAPGTGKTYSMVAYALAIVDNLPLDRFCAENPDRRANVARYQQLIKEGQIVFTTFHQNYGYEEFIQGLRPDQTSGTMAFKTVDGVFKMLADRALKDTDGKNYVMIIDEINRANISKVFGELIALIEEDKRWGEPNEISTTLQSGDPFAVPNNLYIVGTMNSADKSISLIDAALRRRFHFIEQKPDSSLVQDPVLKSVLENINLSLAQELDSTDLLVGHSYFMNRSQKELCSILNENIIPLLYEYFYDNRKKVANLLKTVIEKSGAEVSLVDEKIARLRVEAV